MMRISTLIGLAALSAAACTDQVTAPLEAPADLDVAMSHVARPFLPGEQQDSADLTRGITYAIWPEGLGQILTQTFTTQSNERLGFVELPAACEPGVLLTIRVREDVGGPILSESNHVATGALDGTFHRFRVFDPATSHGIRLMRLSTYAIELSAFPGPTGVTPTCGIIPGPPGESYAGGQAYYEDVPTNGPGWMPFPFGEDLPFITLVN